MSVKVFFIGTLFFVYVVQAVLGLINLSVLVKHCPNPTAAVSNLCY